MRGLFLVAVLSVAGCGSPAAEQTEPEPPPIAFAGALVSDQSARIAHGSRLADVLGCRGCHGKELQGRRFYELYASNLTRDLAGYTDEQLERLLRDGVHPTGRDVWGMPSELFQHLSEPDMAALVAHLRTLKPSGSPTQPHLPWESETEQMIAEGKLMPSAKWVQKTKSTTPVDLGPQHPLGRYISMVTCAECHGPKLDGREGGTPDLIVIGGYTREEFDRLMTTGAAPGGRKLNELMENVAIGRFSKLTPHERDALYAYLKVRAEQPQ